MLTFSGVCGATGLNALEGFFGFFAIALDSRFS
jgi:hypothetical protein